MSAAHTQNITAYETAICYESSHTKQLEPDIKVNFELFSRPYSFILWPSHWRLC